MMDNRQGNVSPGIDDGHKRQGNVSSGIVDIRGREMFRQVVDNRQGNVSSGIDDGQQTGKCFAWYR